MEEKKHSTKSEKKEKALFNIGPYFSVLEKFLNKLNPGKSISFSNFLKKTKPYVLLFLILFCVFASVSVRLSPLTLPKAEQAAEQTLLQNFEQQALLAIDQEYPTLHVLEKKHLAQQQVVEYQNTEEFLTQKEMLAENIKTLYQDQKGLSYLIGFDPYQYLRYVKNIVEHGYPGDQKEQGKQIDTHMIGPLGKEVRGNFHVYASAYLYKFLHVFYPSLRVVSLFFFIPVIFAALALIPAFLIGKRLGGVLTGLFAALLIAIHPKIIQRTVAGFPDTDVYALFFPLLIVWLYLFIFDKNSLTKKIIFAVFAGIATGLFAYVWIGWWYVYDFLIIATILYLGYQAWGFRNKERSGFSFFTTTKAKNYMFSGLTYIISTSIVVALLTKWHWIFRPITGPLSFLRIGQTTKTGTLWPNVFATVTELEQASRFTVIREIGWIIFIIALVGLGILFYRIWREWREWREPTSKQNILPVQHLFFYTMLLGIWFIGTFFASTRGIRFIFLTMLPLAFLFGFTLTYILAKIKEWIALVPLSSSYVSYLKKITTIIFVLFILLVFGLLPFSPVCYGGVCEKTFMLTKEMGPLFNDNFYSVMNTVNMEADKDAIITTWWDYGHIIKEFSDRAVTFDGASQNTPQAYLVGKMFMTEDEEEAIGLLRLMNCGANKSISLTQEHFEGDTLQTVNLVEKLTTSSREEAKQLLAEHQFSPRQIDELVPFTHCEPPQSLVVTSNEMLEKAETWGHFGLWNFSKAKIADRVGSQKREQAIDMLQKEFSFSEKQAIQLVDFSGNQTATWISPWPRIYENKFPCEIKDKESIFCLNVYENQPAIFLVTFDGSGKPINAQLQQKGKEPINPYSIVYLNKEGFQEHTFSGKTLPLSLALIREKDAFSNVLLDPLHAKTIFTRLFFFKGVGLPHFNLFLSHEGDDAVQVWEVGFGEK